MISGEPTPAVSATGRGLDGGSGTAQAAPAVRAAPVRSGTLSSSVWTVGGHAASQVLRFANNLVLTYLIDPSLIGLMGTASVFLAGLQLMSDFGVGPALIQNVRGEERSFQDTAWTLHVVRGAAIWLLTIPLGLLLSWFYAAQAGADSLVWLVPTLGLSALIGGFHSTAIYLRNRRLDMRPIVLLDVGAQTVGCVFGVVWCWFDPSLAALVAAVLAHQVVFTAGSWRLGPPNRPRWERDALATVVQFGRWIWLSTMLTWVATQVDRVLLPRRLSFDGMAVYQVALMIAAVVPETVHVLASRVLFPTMADLVRRRVHLSVRVGAMRRPIVLLGVATLTGLALFGDVLVHQLYPKSFRDSGWMLRLLAAAAIPQTVTASNWYGFFAQGRSALPMCLQAARLLLKATAMLVGFRALGMPGVVFGLLAAEVVHYPLVAIALHRHGLLQLRIDLPILLSAAAVVGLGFWLR